MQINLKQTEITVALKQYISQQGINLAGKEVVIAFTAGRKESGISAEITINDNELPDFFVDETVAVTTPSLVLVQDTVAEADPVVEVAAAPAAVPTSLFT